ncbi:SWI/SNF chromatin-remodeling complex subunit [Recurvomyces mirabilis]|nr:SWI/SNF chromatin-remodeling complex subunit [Recurvomyces mirabilis]
MNETQHLEGGTGAVQPPADGDNYDDGHVDTSMNVESRDAIREGKQKAKEIMAAAGASPATSQPRSLPGDMSNGTPQANGKAQLSRKRSRDGTQLPTNQTKVMVLDQDGTEHTHDEVLLDRYIQRDLVYGAAMNDHEERSRDLIKLKEREKEFYLHDVKQARQIAPGSVFGYGFMGYGNRLTEGKSQIVYNKLRGPPKGRRCPEVYSTRKDNAQQSEHHEELVPVRLDIELDKLRLRDTFTWNLHEKLISPDMYADYLIEDLKIPPEAIREVSQQVKAEMHEQIHNYYPHVIVEDGPLESGRPYNDHKDDEMRVQIKLNITIGRITLVDQFEWDINNPLNSPEEFARQMAWENALSGEFTTAIAHTIREQSQLYTKSLYLTDHCFDGRPILDSDLRDAFLTTPIHGAFRPVAAQKDWTPYMYEMSEAELERTETSMMREHRAQKRQLNRRGGPALPDLKDRQRTVRSLIVHSVIPGAVDKFETTGIPKTRRGGRGARRGARGEADSDSEELEGEESAPESPAPSALNPGTARTRGMRGAATAAQAAMRAGYGARSATPDSQMHTPHEPRTAPRRSMLREGSVMDDGDTLIVKLRIGKAKLRVWWEEYRAKKRASEYPLSGYASQPPPPNSGLRVGTPQRGAVTTPSITPRTLPQPRSTPQPNGTTRSTSTARNGNYDPQGRADTDHWPTADETAPPPPTWLDEAMLTLRSRHPESDFEPIMRPYAVDTTNGKTVKVATEPGALPPGGVKFQFLPRIRCNDCPGKLYTAQPGKVVEDFEVHLRNRNHRLAVQERQVR